MHKLSQPHSHTPLLLAHRHAKQLFPGGGAAGAVFAGGGSEAGPGSNGTVRAACVLQCLTGSPSPLRCCLDQLKLKYSLQEIKMVKIYAFLWFLMLNTC